MNEVTVFAGLITAPIDNLIPLGIFMGIAIVFAAQLILEKVLK